MDGWTRNSRQFLFPQRLTICLAFGYIHAALFLNLTRILSLPKLGNQLLKSSKGIIKHQQRIIPENIIKNISQKISSVNRSTVNTPPQVGACKLTMPNLLRK